MFKTLAYADVFDHPLTKKEIDLWLIAGDDLSEIHSQSDLIVITDGFYHLPSRQKIVALRRRRKKFSQLKRRQAQKTAKILSLIPWVKMIALTGALAMDNADREDDIDLMIVTQKDRLWLTRIMALTILLFMGRLRRFSHLRGGRMDSSGMADKFCLNLWLDETTLNVPKNQRSLYTAHEVAQAKPIFIRGNAYQKFIKANLWLKRYLPNWSA